MSPWPICPVHRHALERPQAEALVMGSVRYTWEMLDVAIRTVANNLQNSGTEAGDCVAIKPTNSPALVVYVLALMRLGARVMLLNTRLTTFEISRQFERVRPMRMIADLPIDGSAENGPVTVHPSAGAILFTSGTTGIPKAALLRHRALISAAKASAARLQTNSSSRWLAALPLFHVGGLAMLFRCICDGSTLILQERFQEDTFAEALEKEAVTHTSLVAVTLERLLKREPFAHPALKVVLVGGGPTPAGLVDQARNAGFPVRLTYGLTEASSQVATQTSAEGYDCGTVLDGLQMRLASDGEIELKGPSLLLCYLHDEAATRASHSDGWFRTGDFGALDEQGHLTVLGRRNDLLISGGENVYPAEIEAALMAHPAVKDAGVVPLDDLRWGQVPLALVVTKDGTLDELSLKEWCRSRLANYKIPARFEPVPSLPRNAMGKLDRRALCANSIGSATSPSTSGALVSIEDELIRTERGQR